MDHFLSLLESGEEATLILEQMRSVYSTPSCLRTKVSLLRRRWYESQPVFVGSGDESFDSLPTFLDQVKAWEAEKAKEVRRKRAWEREERTDSTKAFQPSHLSTLTLLPSNLLQLKISPQEMDACKKARCLSVVGRNRDCVKVEDGSSLLDWCLSHLDPLTSTLYERILSLLLVTGRRTVEVVRGEGFHPLPGQEYGCLFSGQAKKGRRSGRGEETHGYPIPLLAPFSKVEACLLSLPKPPKPSNPPSASGVENEGCGEDDLSLNRSLSSKYQSGLRQKLVSLPEWKGVRKVHDARAVYARLVSLLFDMTDCPCSDSMLVSHILGHSSLQETLVYTATRIKNPPSSLECSILPYVPPSP